MKYTLLYAIYNINNNHETATTKTIHNETGETKAKIRSSLHHYHQFKYIKKSKLNNPAEHDGCLYSYELTSMGFSVLKKLHARAERGYDLNLRHTPAEAGDYVRYSEKEIKAQDKAQTLLEELLPTMHECFNVMSSARSARHPDDKKRFEYESMRLMKEAKGTIAKAIEASFSDIHK